MMVVPALSRPSASDAAPPARRRHGDRHARQGPNPRGDGAARLRQCEGRQDAGRPASAEVPITNWPKPLLPSTDCAGNAGRSQAGGKPRVGGALLYSTVMAASLVEGLEDDSDVDGRCRALSGGDAEEERRRGVKTGAASASVRSMPLPTVERSRW